MECSLVVASAEYYVEIKRLLNLSSVESDNAKSLKEARLSLCDIPYSLLIVDNMISDGSAREFAIEQSRRDDLDIILLVNPKVAERVAVGLEKYGIFVLSKPIRESEFFVMLRNIRVSRRRLDAMMAKCNKLTKRLDEERRLSKAKCLLALNEKMEEDEAHKYLERKAMNERVSLLDASISVITKYSKS